MEGPDAAQIHDVWSRTAPKYRTRAVLLLIANTLLFGILCCFMFWLRTGWYFPPSYEYYSQLFIDTLNITGESQITMHNLLMEPISLTLVPMQAVVIGLLIASLISIPILMTILYRLPTAIAFCAMVSFLAVMPWLGATLLLACIIATYFRIKLKFRFAAALLALIPIGVYYFTASRGYTAPDDVLTPQIMRGIVVVPLLLSAIVSCALMAIVLFIAKVVNYRPGAIAPLLALMLVMPWLLFLGRVGRDELHYRLLENHYGPRADAFFAPADTREVARRVARRWWVLHEDPKPSVDVLQQQVVLFFDLQLDPVEVGSVERAIEQQDLRYQTLFAKQQHRVAMECDKFLADFPDSRYVPCVLYIKGRALDMRVDMRRFRRDGLLRYYYDFPNEASRSTWSVLVEHYPNSPLAVVGRHQLAMLDARAGHVEAGLAWLGPLSRLQQPEKRLAADDMGLFEKLEKKPPEETLTESYQGIATRAKKLFALLLRNREAITGDAALVMYMNCDPRHVRYHQNLQEINERFPVSKLQDNIALQLALLQPAAARRIVELEKIRRLYAHGDTQPDTLRALGQAYLEEGKWTEARGCFDELARRWPGSSAAAQARVELPLGRLVGQQAAGEKEND